MARLTARSILRERSVRALLTAEAVSALGSQMTYLALPWFVLVTTGSASRMGLVLAVQLLPTALLGIPSGTLVTRLGARRTMLLGDAARAPLMISIPLLYEAGLLSFPLLLAVVFAIGCFMAPYFSSQRIILPEIVGDDERAIAQANAIVEGVQRATMLVGPASAGLLISVVGATNVLYVDAATFVFAFVILKLFVPARPPLAAADQPKGVLAGLRYLFRDPLLRALAITALFLNGFGQMLTAGLSVLAYEEYGSSRVAGIFFASFGAGAIAGTVVAVKLMPRVDPVRLGASAIVALSLPLFALPFPLPAAAVVAALFCSAFFGPLVNAPLIGTLTARTPEALRPKVMTALMTMALLAGPLGMAIAGPLLGGFGPRPVFLLVALGQLAAGLPFAAVAFRLTRPAAAAPAPSPVPVPAPSPPEPA